ncbi:hypothetical protein ACWEEK_15545 [Micromonospora aurantiaca (nom. illeg.)]
MLGHQRADRGEVGVPADEAGQLGAQVGAAGVLPAYRLAAQQGDVQRRQLRRRVGAQRVGERVGGALVDQQRLGERTTPSTG